MNKTATNIVTIIGVHPDHGYLGYIQEGELDADAIVDLNDPLLTLSVPDSYIENGNSLTWLNADDLLAPHIHVEPLELEPNLDPKYEVMIRYPRKRFLRKHTASIRIVELHPGRDGTSPYRRGRVLTGTVKSTQKHKLHSIALDKADQLISDQFDTHIRRDDILYVYR